MTRSTLRILGSTLLLFVFFGAIMGAMFALVWFGGTWGLVVLLTLLGVFLVAWAYGYARSMESLKQ